MIDPIVPDWTPLWQIREVEGGYEVFSEETGATVLRTEDYELARRIYIYPQLFRAAHHLNQAWSQRYVWKENIPDEHIEKLSFVLGQMMAWADGDEILSWTPNDPELKDVPRPKSLAEEQQYAVLREFGRNPEEAYFYDLSVPWVRAMLLNDLDPDTHLSLSLLEDVGNE